MPQAFCMPQAQALPCPQADQRDLDLDVQKPEAVRKAWMGVDVDMTAVIHMGWTMTMARRASASASASWAGR